MGVLFAFIAGLFTSITNLCVRKGVDVGGQAKAFFACQICACTIFSLLLGPIRQNEYYIPLEPALLGIVAGLLLSIMLFSLGRAVEKGPAGFTFAILNSATVMPGVLMALLFGASNGFIYTPWHAIGSLLVLIGLFWASTQINSISNKKLWYIFATITFLFHMLLLCLFQYRAMLIKKAQMTSFETEWFTPVMFFTCSCVQLIIYFASRSSRIQIKEILFGTTGGLTNLLCTLLLLFAIQIASPLEQAILFPTFSVAGIILTNLWSQKLYNEEVNWKACQLSTAGLLVGTVDWDLFASAL